MSLSGFTGVEVILAEDEEMFRDMALHAFQTLEWPEDHTHVAEDGLQAIQVLDKIQKEAPSSQVIMFLDVRMPNLDGNECAKRIRDQVKNGTRPVSPFMVCCSANIRDLTDDPKECVDFHMAMPKNFAAAGVLKGCFEKAIAWSGAKGAPSAASSSRPAAKIEIVIADDEEICRMAIMANIDSDETQVEVQDKEEMLEALEAAQSRSGPLLVLLGKPCWAKEIARHSFVRKPYIVNSSAESCEDGFHATLPTPTTHEGIEQILSKACRWWQDGCR
eukprot:gb/GFBE01004599.1/.p1 GENE.gb/GFBE01004599.1/~~gb/GFBE01004599.1/.p1  ORF type:complete len:275 (+),score=46.50 gb/GFBE01004599.1/:1-825(+)